MRVVVLAVGVPSAHVGVVQTNLTKPTGAWCERYEVTMLNGAFGEPRESTYRVLDTFLGRKASLVEWTVLNGDVD